MNIKMAYKLQQVRQIVRTVKSAIVVKLTANLKVLLLAKGNNSVIADTTVKSYSPSVELSSS